MTTKERNFVKYLREENEKDRGKLKTFEGIDWQSKEITVTNMIVKIELRYKMIHMLEYGNDGYRA